MKKHITFLFLLALTLTACQNDDTDFSAYTEYTVNTIHITYNGTSVTMSQSAVPT